MLLELGYGNSALDDIQYATECGLQQAKQQGEYYCRLAKANACKCNRSDQVIHINKRETLVRHFSSLETGTTEHIRKENVGSWI